MQVLLWCWDARMTWDDEPTAISHAMAGENTPFPYAKRAESFLVGFKRLVDYAAGVGVRGIVVWGFLRDCHGGVKAAADLCRYASDRGVAIIPGVGVCSYGGFYFDGDHPFNLRTYLKQHPQRATRAVAEHSDRVVDNVLDPSDEANHRWWREGLEWMLETFKVSGLNFEMGDFLVNSSDSARAARDSLGFTCDDNIRDMVVATRDLVRHGLELLPGGLFINSTYRGYHQVRGFPRMPYTAALPARTVWQYTLTNMVKPADFATRCTGAPAHRRYGCLHWFNSSTRSMQRDYVPEIARVWPGVHQLGFDYIGTYGEVRADRGDRADRNYRAQVAWAENPGLSLADF